MNLKIPGSLSWAAFLEMGARLENSPNPKSPVSFDRAFIFGTIYLLAVNSINE